MYISSILRSNFIWFELYLRDSHQGKQGNSPTAPITISCQQFWHQVTLGRTIIGCIFSGQCIKLVISSLNILFLLLTIADVQMLSISVYLSVIKFLNTEASTLESLCALLINSSSGVCKCFKKGWLLKYPHTLLRFPDSKQQFRFAKEELLFQFLLDCNYFFSTKMPPNHFLFLKEFLLPPEELSPSLYI